jgi:type VI secretion system protein VasJ
VSCAAALSATSSLLEVYWNELHPSVSRVQRRIAPLKWLAARLELRVAALAKNRGERRGRYPEKRMVARLQAILDARFDDAAPSFGGLLRLPGDEAHAAPFDSPSRHSRFVNMPQVSSESHVPS